MEKFLISLLCLLVLLGCNSRETPSLLEPASTFKGQIESPLQGWYKIAQSTSTVPGEEAFIGYNEHNHSLDLFRLQDGTVVFDQLIKLTSDGPKGIDEVRGLYYVNQDSIFLVSRNNIVLINAQNEELYRVSTTTQPGNAVEGLDLSLYQPNVRQEAGVNLAVRGDKIFLPLNYSASEGALDLAGVAPDVLLLGYYSLRQKKFYSLPIHYPKFLQEKLYGFGSSPQFAYTKDKVIYSFTGFPDLYIYDLQAKTTEHLPVANDFPRTPPFEGMELGVHLQSVVTYTDGVVSPDGSTYTQAVLVPNVETKGRKVLLRVTNLSDGQAKFITPPPRHAFNGMLTVQAGVLMPKMPMTEDSIGFTQLAF